MLVSLREGASGSTASPAGTSPISIRGDGWLAVANPDEHRLRYLDRTSGRVIHFPAGEIGRAHVCTPVRNEPLVCRLLLETKTVPPDYTHTRAPPPTLQLSHAPHATHTHPTTTHQ